MRPDHKSTSPNTARWFGPLIVIGVALVLGACGVVDGLTGGTTTEPPPTIGAQEATTSAPPSDDEQAEGGDASATEDSTGVDVMEPPELCVALPGLPYAVRQRLIDALDTDGLGQAQSICPEDLAVVEAIATVADQSAQLNVEGAHTEGAGAITCDDVGIIFNYRNKFDFPIRMIVVGAINVAGEVIGTTWAVTDPIAPEEFTKVEMGYEGFRVPANGANCSVLLQGFLELDEEVTDTWDSALGSTEPLPTTDGEPDLAMIVEMIAAERAVNSSADWELAGGFEDVRSKNYLDLISRIEPLTNFDTTVSLVCSTDEISDDLVAIVWTTEDANSGLETASLGVFHRSSIDGHWRWVHTGMALEINSSCGLIA